MTAKEKVQIEKAIAHLHEDDGWDRAMKILLALIGRKPKDCEVEPTTFAEIVKRYGNK